MDPTAALKQALEALMALKARHDELLPDEQAANTVEERQEAVDCLAGLTHWLNSGGFPPDVEDAVAGAGFAAE